MAENNPAKRKCLSFGPENVTCVGETDRDQEKCTFLWTVKKFSMITNTLSSPVFRGGPRNNHSWQVKMNTNKEIEGMNYLSLYLKLVNFGNTDDSKNRTLEAHFQLSILNADEASIGAQKQFRKFKKGGPGHGRHNIISLANLSSPDKRIVADDSMKILCEIWTYGKLVEIVKIVPSEDERNTVIKRSAPDFGKLFRESVPTDITIKAETTGQIFKAHKAILTARSPVFAAMFNATMKTDTVEIKATDEVIKGMLEHIYTNHTDYLPKVAVGLLRISHKYDLADLKEDSEFALTDMLNNESVAIFLILAYTCNAPFLKQKAIGFIQANMKELLNLKSFQDIMKKYAGTKVYKDVFFSPQ